MDARMRQLTFVDPGKLEWRDVDQTRVDGAGEAIIEPVAAVEPTPLGST
jgi:alcohol dehydrogenase